MSCRKRLPRSAVAQTTSGGRPRPGGGESISGFTITEVVIALGLTLMVAGSFGLLLRQGRLSLELQPELAAMRQDGRAILDRIAADLGRAGAGLPVEIPVFADLDSAGDRNPDGLDFLTAPERLAETSFEPVVAFDGGEATLGHPDSRLDRGPVPADDGFVMVFNDDEMTPRWAFGRVTSIRGGRSGGSGQLLGALRAAGARTGTAPPEDAAAAGAVVRIVPLDDAWHRHFRPSVDADTFEPGSGGGLLERGLQSVLGGAIEAAVPGIGRSALSSLTDQVVNAMLERLLETRGGSVGSAPDAEESEGYGLFGLGQPGVVPIRRIRYWVEDAAPSASDGRSVLMRRVDEDRPQPVGFVEDLQVRYVIGQNGDRFLDAPPRFVGDMASAARLRDHIVRAVDVAVRVRAARSRNGAGFSGDGASAGDGAGGVLTRTYRRRVALRVGAAGVERRAWEELMQMNSLPTEIPRIGPLRYLPLPW